MRREFSAGGVVVRRMRGRWWMAAIRPRGKPAGTWTLPKGLVDEGESPEAAAVREAYEETGVRARLGLKLGDSKYVYVWEGERVFKIVSFFLLHRLGGTVGELPPGMDLEVAEARWLPLEDALRLLAYKGEREIVAKAIDTFTGAGA